MNISHFDALIHPDYVMRERLYQTRHPVQEALNNKWNQRFTEIAKDPATALIYYSAYSRHDYREGTIPKNRKLFPIEKKRIETLKELLGNRFVYFNSGDFPYRPILDESFLKQGLLYIPETTTLKVYGEIYEACVSGEDSWGEVLKKELGLSDSNYYPDPELSLPHSQVMAIENWHASKEGGGFPLEKA